MKIYYEALINRLMSTGLSRDLSIELLRLAMQDLIVFNEDDEYTSGGYYEH